MRVPAHSLSVGAGDVAWRAEGFTLVEWLIAIALAADLLVNAVPGFIKVIRINCLDALTNTIVGVLDAARMGAIKRNTTVQCRSNVATTLTNAVLGTACGSQGGKALVLTTMASITPLLAASVELSIPSVRVHRSIQAVSFGLQGWTFEPGTTMPSARPYPSRVSLRLHSAPAATTRRRYARRLAASSSRNRPPETVHDVA